MATLRGQPVSPQPQLPDPANNQRMLLDKGFTSLVLFPINQYQPDRGAFVATYIEDQPSPAAILEDIVEADGKIYGRSAYQILDAFREVDAKITEKPTTNPKGFETEGHSNAVWLGKIKDKWFEIGEAGIPVWWCEICDYMTAEITEATATVSSPTFGGDGPPVGCTSCEFCDIKTFEITLGTFSTANSETLEEFARGTWHTYAPAIPPTSFPSATTMFIPSSIVSSQNAGISIRAVISIGIIIPFLLFIIALSIYIHIYRRQARLRGVLKDKDIPHAKIRNSVKVTRSTYHSTRDSERHYLRNLLNPLTWLSRRQPKPDEIRISYTCTCGKRIHGIFPAEQEYEATSIAHELILASDKSIAGSSQPTSINSSNNSINGSTLGSPVTRDNTSRDLPPNTFGIKSCLETNSQESSSQNSAVKQRFLFLCVDTSMIGRTGRHRVDLSSVDVSENTVWNDQLLFHKIRDAYYSKRPPKLLSLHTPMSLYFIKFELVPKRSKELSIAITETPSLPPAEEVNLKLNYHYKPCPTKGIHVPDNIFFDAFFDPGVHLHEWCLNRLPKKLDQSLDGNSNSGWGIYIVEGPDWYVISLLVAVIFLASGFFGVLWSVLRHDLQGGFAIASYLATLGTAAMTAFFFR